MDGGQHQQDYQKDYFQAIIKQYENQNAQFRERQCNLRHRLEAIECSMPALMCFNMMQGRSKQPENPEYDRNPVKEQPSSNSQNENKNFRNIRNDMNLRSCDCNPCPLNADFQTRKDPKTINEAPTINIRNDINMRSCKCNPCPLSEDTKSINSAQNAFTSMASDTFYQNNQPKLPDTTIPDNVTHITKLKGLVQDEKKLKEEIEELEHKQRIYTETLKQTHAKPNNEIGCNGEGDFEIQALKRMNQELEANNKTLEEELEEVKREIKYIQDSVEQPMRKELENERRKYMDLEEKIHTRSADISNRESAHGKKVIFLERQLQSAGRNLNDLHVINKRLKEELCMLNCRYNELQTDLINQKLSEIHTISRMTAAQDKQTYQPPLPKPVLSLSGVSSGEDLNNIARNLSKLLQEATACDSCKSAHPDLIDTVQYIKELVEIVNRDKKKPDKFDKESLSELFCKCVDLEKLRAEMVIEDTSEPPTHEIFSPKKILSEESTSAATTKESKLEARARISEKRPTRVDVDRPSVTSGLIAVKEIQDILIDKLASEERVLDESSKLVARTSEEIIREEVDQKGTIESEAPTDTEDTDAVTDVTPSASATEGILTESELATEISQLEGAELLTDTEERTDLHTETLAEEETDEGHLLETEIIEELLSSIAPILTETEPERLYDVEELDAEKETLIEDSAAEIIDEEKEIVFEETLKTESKEHVLESEPNEEVEILDKSENILEAAGEVRQDDEDIQITEGDVKMTEGGDEKEEGIASEDTERADDTRDSTVDESTNKQDITPESIDGGDGEKEIPHIEQIKDIAPLEDVDILESTKKSNETMEKDTDLKARSEELSLKLEDKLSKGESVDKRSERKDSIRSVPVTENEIVADIVRTICRCIRREEPQLCDCPIEKKRSPKSSTKTSKEILDALPLDEIKDVVRSSEAVDEAGPVEIVGSHVPGETASVVSQDETEEQTHQDKPPTAEAGPDEIIGSHVPGETASVVSQDETEEQTHQDKPLTAEEVSPKTSTTSSRKSKSGIIVEGKSDKRSSSPKHSKPASRESIKKSVHREGDVASLEQMEAKENAKKASSKSLEKLISPRASKPSSKNISEHLLPLDNSTSKEKVPPSKESENASLPKEGVDKTVSDIPIRSPKTTSKEPSTRSLPSGKTARISASSIKSVETSKILSKKSLPKKSTSSANILLEEKISKQSATIITKSPPRSKLTSKEPSIKSIPEDVIIKPAPSAKSKEEIVDTGIKSCEIIVPREQSAKLQEELGRGESHLSKKQSSKAPFSEMIPQPSSTEEGDVEEPMLSASIEAEAEGNIPTETDVELISKSSDGVYVTTTVTSSGHVEVTTEGPTGVVETTLKVTESGNLEVTTDVTEYEKPDGDSAKGTKSDHSKDDDIPEVEVIHGPVHDMKESQDALDIQESHKLSDHGPTTCSASDISRASAEKVVEEEVRQPSDGVLGVITEEEETVEPKDKEFVEVECQCEESEAIPTKIEPPPEPRYCECPPPLVICKCDSDEYESQEGRIEEDVRDISAVKLIDATKTVDDAKVISIMKPQDDIISIDSRQESTIKKSAEPLIENIKSVEIIEETSLQNECYEKPSDEFEYEEVISGSTISDVSLFDDLKSEHSRQFKKQTSGSIRTRSLVIEEQHTHESEESVPKPTGSSRLNKTSKSILKHAGSTYDNDLDESQTVSNTELNDPPIIIKLEYAATTTSTSELKFISCTCEKQLTPNEKEKPILLSDEEKQIVPIVESPTTTSTCHLNLKSCACAKQLTPNINENQIVPTDEENQIVPNDGEKGIAQKETQTAPKQQDKTENTAQEKSEIPQKQGENQIPRKQQEKEDNSESSQKTTNEDRIGNTTVNNLKIIICNRDICKTYASDHESSTDILKCQCSKENQRPRICNKKTCGTSSKNRQDKKDKSSERDSSSKLLLENATCTTCDKTSCQIIKSRTQYASSESVFEDGTYVCPDTCSNVGVQHTPRKQNLSFVCPKSCNDIQKKEQNCTLNEKKTMSYPRGVCASSYTDVDDKKDYTPSCKEKGVQKPGSPSCTEKGLKETYPCDVSASSCSGVVDRNVSPPTCREKGVQESGRSKRSTKSHFTNTPKSSRMCKLDICDSKASAQRTVSTYYSCNQLEKDSPMPQAEKYICDPNVCKKGVSLAVRPKSPSAPQMSRICKSKTCKTDAYTEYKPETAETRKASIIKQSVSENLQRVEPPCKCKKPAEKSDAMTETVNQPISSTVVEEKSSSIMETACTSLTCSVFKVDRSVKSQTPSNILSETIPCSSATCSKLMDNSVKSQTPSNILSETIPCSSATCSKLIDNSVKSQTPSNILSETIPCSSATCSKLMDNSVKSQTPSNILSETIPCSSATCSKLIDNSVKSQTPSNILSETVPCSSATCSKLIDNSVKSQTPSNILSETIPCSSATCSKMIDNSVKSQTPSNILSETIPCSSATCSKLIDHNSIKSQTPSNILSKTIPCSSATCSGLIKDYSVKSQTTSNTLHEIIPCSSATCSGLKAHQSVKSKFSSNKSSSTYSYTCIAMQSLRSEESRCTSATCLDRLIDVHSGIPNKVDEKKASSIMRGQEEIHSKSSECQNVPSKYTSASSVQGLSDHPVYITPDSSKPSSASNKKLHSESSPTDKQPSTITTSKKSDASSSSSKKSNLSTSSTKKIDIGQAKEKKEGDFDDKDYKSPKKSQEMSERDSHPSKYPIKSNGKDDTFISQKATSEPSSVSCKDKPSNIKYRLQDLDESPIEAVTVETLEAEIRTSDHISKSTSQEIGTRSEEKARKKSLSSDDTAGTLAKGSKMGTPKTQQNLAVDDRQKAAEITDMQKSSKIADLSTEPASPEIVKSKKLSTGDVPTSPKSASRYTLTEKLPSVSDKSKPIRRASQSLDQSEVMTTKEGPLSTRSSDDKRDTTLSKIQSTADEKGIAKKRLREVEDSAHSTAPSQKSSKSSQGEEKSSEKTSKGPSKESDKIEKMASKSSKRSTTRSSEISVKNLEQKSSEKLPAEKQTSKRSIKSSESSICQPCDKVHGKASGDVSKEIKKPPDKGSKTSIHSTESEKRSKSKIPIPVSQTPSQIKEKHHGDCACMECLTQEKQKDGHPPDCDCVDCLCQPSKFEQKLPRIDEAEKEAESLQHSLSCTCIDCLCQPQGDKEQVKKSSVVIDDKLKHSPSCLCVDCLCEPSIETSSIILIERDAKKQEQATYKCPSLPPTKRHHPNCKCPSCVCDPCGHLPNCSCKLCTCNPCKDEIVQFKKHPPDCTCPECICSPCGDQKKKKQHPMDCDCPKCICDPCSDKKVEAEKRQTHVEDGDCTCEECVCDPCDDPKVVRAKNTCDKCACLICICDPCDDSSIAASRKPHPPSCNCIKCLCDPCNDPMKSKAHGPDCTCRKCICQPCKSDGQDHGPDCKCPTCVCPNPQKKELVHGPDCKCEKCVCQPCKSDANEHGPNCNCSMCICNPCLDPTKKRSLHGLDCNCPKCKCNKEAVVPVETHSPNCRCSVCKTQIQKEVLKPKLVESKESLHGPDCACEKCTCDPCRKIEEPPKEHSVNCKCSVCKAKPKETFKPKFVEPPKKHSPNCKCSDCKLSRSISKEITKTKPIVHQTDLSDIPEECPECDCSPICVCDDCPAKRNDTAPVPQKLKDEALKKNIKDIEKENVRRAKDMKEIEKLMKQIRCACNDAEKQAVCTSPPEPTLIQRTASFKNTLSGLQIAMNTLEDKCRVKDKMIDAMTQELRLRANSNIFNDMFRNMASLSPVDVDFDMHEICDSLPRPSNDPRYGRPSYRYAEEAVTNAICRCESGSLSLKITNVKQISPNSILVKWTPPANSHVIGYEVVVENILKSRIHSACRTSAVVFGITMKSKLNISVYALTQFGRCEPPATCVYG